MAGPSTISREMGRNAGQDGYVSHETIYRSLFIQARGALKTELLEQLSRTRGMRRSRSYTHKTAIHWADC